VRTLDLMRRMPWATAGATVALAIGVNGCGDDDFANDQRAPSPITLSASITRANVTVSPSRLGAGSVELIASNLTGTSQQLTLSSRSLEGGGERLEQRTGPINPGDTASLTANLEQGVYSVSSGSGAITPATIRVGPPRASAQDELVQP
jgi:hypothetical protein